MAARVVARGFGQLSGQDGNGVWRRSITGLETLKERRLWEHSDQRRRKAGIDGNQFPKPLAQWGGPPDRLFTATGAGRCEGRPLAIMLRGAGMLRSKSGRVIVRVMGVGMAAGGMCILAARSRRAGDCHRQCVAGNEHGGENSEQESPGYDSAMPMRASTP